jgi:hypothetical protein
MQKLLPFQGTLPFGIGAEISIYENILSFEYKIDAGAAVAGLPWTSENWLAEQVRRADQLWATTCFEAFLRPVGQGRYYEFNFSLSPAWNVYEFHSYREPQPPPLSKDFELQSFRWQAKPGLLTIQLLNKSPFREFDVSLTAVVEMKDRSKHYLAQTHAESKPDFHSAKSFTLFRGKKS